MPRSAQPPEGEKPGPSDTAVPATSALSLFWTPLVAVGSSGPRGPNAQVSVSTFGASIVPDRPRLLCVLYRDNLTRELVLARGSFSISVLVEGQEALVQALGFASGRERDKLAGLDYELTARGNPVFAGSLAWLECDVLERFDLGDATAFLSAVVEQRPLWDGLPLYWWRLRPRLPAEWQQAWDEKIARDIERSRRLMRWL
jgi:flavin reductase (DIM6/NTAB) family NADH-FMN oxidoreductase RutF